MAAPNVLNVIRGPARLILNPTDLTAAYPYGGTELGLARGCIFEYGTTTHYVTAEEWANRSNAVYCGDAGAIRCVLRGWDADAIGTVARTYAAGNSGAPTIAPDTNTAPRAGTQIPGYKILMAQSESPATMPSVLVYYGLPAIDPEAQLELSRNKEAGTAVRFDAAPDSSGRTYFVGLIGDMTL